MKFFEALGNVFRIPDLRKRVLFTLAMLAVYRLGGHIPTPGINMSAWEQFFSRAIDFGFTKTANEALTKWGGREILSDTVWVIRRFRPDVIVLRFTGTPRDGHGQHQASAIIGKEA